MWGLKDRALISTRGDNRECRARPRRALGRNGREGSLIHDLDGSPSASPSATASALAGTYRGIVPDLFREGSGVVAEGRMERGVFVADTILAKHDERYMPPQMDKLVAPAK